MGDSKLLPDYLSEDLNNNKIRCIAAYIFDQPHNFKDGYNLSKRSHIEIILMISYV